MLRAAESADVAVAQALWAAPAHAMLFQPPEPGEAATLAGDGQLHVWAPGGRAVGFAALAVWDVPGGVFWVRAFAVAEPGRGHGRAFLAALLSHLFQARGAHRIGLDVTLDNAPAQALYAAAGFVREGILRECWLRPDGAHVDCVMMSLLRREWQMPPP